MATRVEAILEDIRVEMVARDVDVEHFWGKKANENHRAVNWITWIEDDDSETIEPPSTTEYELPDGEYGRGQSAHAVYDRAVPLTITVCGEDRETSESMLEVLLAAAYQKLTVSGFEPKKAPKRGERPTSRGHVRILGAVIRLPVFDQRLNRFPIVTKTLDAQATDALGLNPESTDQP